MNDKSYLDMLRDEEYSPEDNSGISARGVAGCAIELGYLLFLLISGCLFLTKGGGTAASLLSALLSFLLGIGDSFYLIPRVRGVIEGKSGRIERLMMRGIFVSYYTVTASHLILLYIWKELFPPITPFPLCALVIWAAAVFRTGAGIFTAGNMEERRYDRRWILYRTVPLVLTGVFLIILFLLPQGNAGSGYLKMSLAILVSTGCSIPLEIWYGDVPGIGFFMIPRAVSYAAMMIMGLMLLL